MNPSDFILDLINISVPKGELPDLVDAYKTKQDAYIDDEIDKTVDQSSNVTIDKTIS